jgi:hypothetical protein
VGALGRKKGRITLGPRREAGRYKLASGCVVEVSDVVTLEGLHATQRRQSMSGHLSIEILGLLRGAADGLNDPGHFRY